MLLTNETNKNRETGRSELWLIFSRYPQQVVLVNIRGLEIETVSGVYLNNKLVWPDNMMQAYEKSYLSVKMTEILQNMLGIT